MSKLTKEHKHIGGALMQLLSHPECLTVKKFRRHGEYNHFMVYAKHDGPGDWRHLFVKLAAVRDKEHRWKFNGGDAELNAWWEAYFGGEDDMDAEEDDDDDGDRPMYLALVCEDELVCVIEGDQLNELLVQKNVRGKKGWNAMSRAIYVEAPPGEQCRVTTALGRGAKNYALSRRVARNAFPKSVLRWRDHER